MRAADMFEEGGITKAEIARRLGVAHQTVSDWHELWERGGRDALRAKGRAGRLPKLNAEQLAKVEEALLKGAKANGYDNDLWALARVAEVIERVTGVGFHPHSVWRVLRQQLGWAHQRPARRAVERDDEAIDRWIKKRWPSIKKRPASGRADRLRRRVRSLPVALGAGHLGPAGPHPGHLPPLRLEADVDGHRARLRA